MNKFAVLVVFSLVSASGWTADFDTRRELDHRFAVDLGFVDQQKLSIQYFYAVQNEDGTFTAGEKETIVGNPFEAFAILDTRGDLSRHLKVKGHEMNDLFIITGKMAYAVPLDISVFRSKTNMFSRSFMKAMNPAMSDYRVIKGKSYQFEMVGPWLVMPNAFVTVSHFVDPYDKLDAIKDAAARKLLGDDPALGKPDAMIVHLYHDFGRFAGVAKASLGSYSYLKLYKLPKNRTLIVESVLIYPYGLLGGPDGMRATALKQVKPKADSLPKFKSLEPAAPKRP